MSRTGPRDLDDAAGSRLKLDIWHPDCWTLEVTAGTSAGLLGHGVYTIGGRAVGRFTVYGDAAADVDALVAATRDSLLTDSVWEMDQQYEFAAQLPKPGNATRGLLVSYEPENSINDALVGRGFIPDRPVQIHDGRECWTVIVNESRDRVQDRLDAVREEMDAEVRVSGITLPHAAAGREGRGHRLSERQREVFELARERGYYEWPRQVSAADLAEELDVSKATLLEHLRKAEAKLLG